MKLKDRIEALFESGLRDASPEFDSVFGEFVGGLNSGQIRAAEPAEGGWRVNHWVKKGILLGFRVGRLQDYSVNDAFRYFDKSTYPLRPLELKDNVRVVPGGTSIRTGSYVAPGVVLMPPAYVNVGAYVGEDSMIDSHALVGSCAQVGARVHLSAAAQVGGVLEPVGAMPVIIEDDVLVGGNSGIYEGAVVRKGAVIGAGTILTGSIPVYDAVNGRVLRKTPEMPLTIPEGAVVVPGTRPLNSEYGVEKRLHLSCAVIVKYRDKGTDAATALEEALR
jgi:2,3,4,5-tetrahydropyridine-2-carboxylate N-succinyltransferase